MASGNGFITYSPDTRYGSTVFTLGGNPAGAAGGQKFTAPGSGTINISEIGLWGCSGSGVSNNIKLGLYSHNASEYPDSMVTNSESSVQQYTSETVSKKSYSYSTKPELTAGIAYWICIMSNAVKNGIPYYSARVDCNTTGGTMVSQVTASYPSWPSFSSHTDGVYDTALYAVWEQVVIMPVNVNYYNNMRP